MSRSRNSAIKNSGRGATRQHAAHSEPRQWSFNWLNRLLILVGSGVVAAAGLQAYITLQAIPVEQITVTGKLRHTQTEAVQQMVQPALIGGFLSADLENIRAQLEALPWIYEASVRRRWPNSLEINVIEQLPIARWGEGGFLNHEGEVFQSANAEVWRDLPSLLGPAGSERELMASYQRLEELLEGVALEVNRLQMDERGQIQAVLSGDITVVLGGDEFLERVQRFVAVYQSDLAERAGDIARVDLRYQSGLAVEFNEPAQVVGLVTE